MSCQEAYSLLSLRPEDLESTEQALLERHLEGCPACRDKALEMLEVSRGVSEAASGLEALPPALKRPPAIQPRRPIWPWAAAAALLMAVALLWKSPEPLPQIPAVPPVQVAAPPAVLKGLCKAESGDLDGVVGRAVSVGLRQGGVLLVEGMALTLKSGALHLDVSREAVSVRVGGALLALEDASVSLEVGSLPQIGWLRSAHAGEATEVRLAVWRGKAEVALAGKKMVLQEGQGTVLRGGTLVPDDGVLKTAWRGVEGWASLEGLPSSFRDRAQALLSAPPGSYVLEALVRKRDAAAELGLRLEGYEFPLGALLPGSTWMRLRVESRPGWRRATLGVSEIVSCPPDRLGKSGYRVDGDGVGLRAWGGDVEVKEVRWREIR